MITATVKEVDMLDKPEDVFDRGREWAAITRAVESDRAGSSLGLVYGRRRQGKTYLLEALVEAAGGLYWPALRQSSAQNLDRLAAAYGRHTRARAGVRFSGWEEAFSALLALGDGANEPLPVVVDEFPYLLEGDPGIPSALQALLSPRGPAAQRWRTRLILCGSALSTMRGLLAGTAPLRGRAELELVVHPFSYRDAAAFWGVAGDADVALRLHALVGGTPAYRDMCGGTAPAAADFDRWVADRLLDPASAMFREGNVLLAEEVRPLDAAMYFSVLAAVSAGRTRRGEIAATVGRAEGALAHPLTVLAEAGLVEALPDALRQRRTTFHVAEPVMRLHQLVIGPNEGRLVRHHGPEVWAEVADTVSARIYGPHFETVARVWCAEHATASTLGGVASRVAPTVVACPEHRSNHEIDVVVTETATGRDDRVIALGEAKWTSRPSTVDQLERLDHLRAVLRLDDAVRLLLFSRHGFSRGLHAAADSRHDVELVDLERLYTGS